MKKILPILLVIVTVGLIGGLVVWRNIQPPSKTQTASENQIKRSLTPEIEAIISKKETLLTGLVKNQTIIAAVKQSGENLKSPLLSRRGLQAPPLKVCASPGFL